MKQISICLLTLLSSILFVKAQKPLFGELTLNNRWLLFYNSNVRMAEHFAYPGGFDAAPIAYSPGIGASVKRGFGEKFNMGVRYSWQKTKVPIRIITGQLNVYTRFPTIGLKLSFHQFGLFSQVEFYRNKTISLSYQGSFDLLITDIGRYLLQGSRTGTVYSISGPDRKADYILVSNHIHGHSFILGNALRIEKNLNDRLGMSLTLPIYIGLTPLVSTAAQFTIDDIHNGTMGSFGQASGFSADIGVYYKIK